MKYPHQSQLVVHDLAVVITRTFDAPVSLVYKVWSEPQHFAKWWGPHTFTNPVCEMDLQAGGRFRVVMRSPEGEDNALTGEFLEIVPNEKIVLQMYTREHTAEWHAIVNAARGLAPDAAPVDPLTTVTFEAVGDQTKISVEQRFLNNVDRDAFVSLGTGIGWGQSFVKMDGLVATLASERDLVLMRTVSASRELVWKVFSDPAHLAKWWGPNGFTNTIYEFDLRTGGEWSYMMHGPDGTDYPNWMRFDEVIPMELIRYTHGGFRDDPNTFLGQITFEEVEGGKTYVTLRLRLTSAEDRDFKYGWGAFEGGDQTLSRLDAFVAAVEALA